jgi:hypothetical protein
VTRYDGGCHCGAVRYELQADQPIQRLISCNCSICSKKGSLMAFFPRSAFTLRSGDDVLTDYLFNRHVVHHQFCSRCGIESFASGNGPDGAEMVMINARCLDGFEFDGIPVDRFDGRSL